MEINLELAVFFVPFVAIVLALIALVTTVMTHRRIKNIFKSASAPDIERLLKLHTATLEDFIKFKTESTEYMKSLNNRIKKKTTNASTLRFNPFQGEGLGGNQSFSSVLADEEGDGVVITSMHTRERTNVFAKPLQKWQSEYQLSEEEKQTVNQAKNNGKK